jgi:TPR repeat protein
MNMPGTGIPMTRRRSVGPIWIAGLIVLLALSPAALADDFLRAKQAYNEKDYGVALALLRPLAKKGDPRAQHLVGDMYYGSKGVHYNYRRAQHWLEKSAAQDYTPGIAALGLLLVKTGKDQARGLRLLRVAFKRGDSDAQISLGVFHLFGRGGVPLDLAKSKEYLLLGAEQKNRRAFLGLQIRHLSDRGKRPDYLEALKWILIGDRMDESVLDDWRQRALKNLTKAQIAEARRRARAWLKAHGVRR